jgi:hypothetical protein
LKKYSGINKINRMAYKYENYLIDGETKTAKVAIVLSRSSEIWSSDAQGDVAAYLNAGGDGQEAGDEAKLANGFSVERLMLHAALRYSNYAVDILPEEEVLLEKLNKYKSIYLYGPNLTLKAQQQLVNWVRKGGVLYINSGAASKDEINQSDSLLSKFTVGRKIIRLADTEKSGRFFEIGAFGEIWSAMSNYKIQHVGELRILGKVQVIWPNLNFKFEAVGRKEIINALKTKTVAKWETGEKAIAILEYGKGKIVKSGVSLGAIMARSAVPSYAKLKSGRRKYSKDIIELISLACKLGGIKQRISCNKDEIIRKWFEIPKKGMLILLANYLPEAQKNIILTVTNASQYSKVLSFSGEKIKSYKDGSDLKIELDLSTAEAIELRP